MVPDASLSIRDRAVAAWPPAWHAQNLRDILVTLGYDVDIPWRKLPQQARDWRQNRRSRNSAKRSNSSRQQDGSLPGADACSRELTNRVPPRSPRVRG